MAKAAQQYKYINIIYINENDPAKTATALADLKLRESIEDPDSNVPPSAKPIGSIKGGTSFHYDKLALMGDVNTPEYFARAIWLHIPDKGWVLMQLQPTANKGPSNYYAGFDPDGKAKWDKMVEAKTPKGGGTPYTKHVDSTPTPSVPATNTTSPWMIPLLVGGAVAIFLLASKKRGIA